MNLPEAGQRIELVAMPDDPSPILPGSTGTVTQVSDFSDGSAQVSVKWDDGRTLMLAIPPDEWRPA